MRMTEYQFVNQMITNVRYIKLRLLFTYPGIECNMQQHVAEFLANILHIVLHQGVTEFISLLYRIRTQTLVGLLTVPRTFLAQCIQHIEHASEGLHLLFTGVSLFHNCGKRVSPNKFSNTL